MNWSEGYGSTSNPVSKTLYAKWTENDSKPDAPKREDLYGILGNFVQVECVSEGDGLPHAAKKYSTNTYYSKNGKYESSVGEVYKADDGAYKVDVTLNGDVYAGLYGFEPDYGTGVEHTLKPDEASTQTITLSWDANNKKWAGSSTKGTVLASFKVVCKSAEPTTYTVIHEYYTNGERDGFTKQENISGKNVGDVVRVDDIDKVLKYTKSGVENAYAYTQANKGTADNSPNGYTLGDVITELTLGKDGNIIVLRYDRNVTPPVTPSLTSLQKQRLTEAPDGVIVPEGINYDQNVLFVGDNAPAATLLYKLTVTGTEGAAYKLPTRKQRGLVAIRWRAPSPRARPKPSST